MLSFISNPFIISTWWVIDRSSAHKSRKFYSYRIDPHHLWIDISLWFTTAPPSSPTTGLLSGCVGTMIGIVILKPLFYMLFTILKHSIMLAISKCILHNTKKGGFFFWKFHRWWIEWSAKASTNIVTCHLLLCHKDLF